MKIIDLKQMYENKIETLKLTRSAIHEMGIPKLTIIQVGDEEKSNEYISDKIKIGNKIGVFVKVIKLPYLITQHALERVIIMENKDEKVHGIVLQYPLPNHINEKLVVELIDPRKDVDGVTSSQIAKLINGDECFKPCMAMNVLDILRNIMSKKSEEFTGKNVTIIGKDKMLGLPVFHLLSQLNCTIIFCDYHTINLKEKIKNADIVVMFMDAPYVFDETNFTDGQIIIDFTMQYIGNKLVGAINCERLNNLNGHITSGDEYLRLLSCVHLMNNTVEACKNINQQ